MHFLKRISAKGVIMEQFKILKLQKDDIDDVLGIEELVRPKHHWSKDSFYNELANNLAAYFGIKNENDILAGYIGIWKIIDEAHITTLAVHPDFQRRQLAQALIIQAVEECYKNMIKYITLEVRESNEPAINLYEKFLFDSIGVRKNYYQDNNENAIIMFTQNIWYDKFKNNYNLIKNGINKVSVQYDK